MLIETKKLKHGFELPLFGFGTWSMGGRDIRDVFYNRKVHHISVEKYPTYLKKIMLPNTICTVCKSQVHTPIILLTN